MDADSGFFTGKVLTACTAALLLSTLLLFAQNRMLKQEIENASGVLGRADLAELATEYEQSEQHSCDEQSDSHPIPATQDFEQPSPGELHSFLSEVAGKVDPDMLRKIEETAQTRLRQKAVQEQQKRQE